MTEIPAPFIVDRWKSADYAELEATIRPIADNSNDPDRPHEEGVAINFDDGKRHFEIVLAAKDLWALLDQFPSEIAERDAELVQQILVREPICICDDFCSPRCDVCQPKVH